MKLVFEQITKTPGCTYNAGQMYNQYGIVRGKAEREEGAFNDHFAFSREARARPKYEWCRDYLSDWPALQWAAMRLVSLSTSATACEHSWSIEAWVHSKKRNRLGQTNVERLMRTHTNLRLQAILQDWSRISQAWDMETLIDEAGDSSEE